MIGQINSAGANFRARSVKGGGAKSGSSGRVDLAPAKPVDKVEISELAWWLGKYAEMPDVRADLVNKVRTQIQTGTYDSEGKMDQAIEGLVEDLTR